MANQTNGAPKNRCDATTQICRVLDDGPLAWESRPWGEGGNLFTDDCTGCQDRNDSCWR